MGIEQKINYQLNKYPLIKKIIKRVYQRCMYCISPKIKSEGDIKKLSPNDGKEYFFGYYDKSPWDATERYVVCLRTEETWKDVSPKTVADIVLIDTCLDKDNPDRVRKIGETNSWNVQQGCMLQWLGPDFTDKIIYNDFRNGKYCAIILSVFSGEEKVIEKPVYTVSRDGKIALSLDFSRLYNLRPGYGYYNIEETTKNQKLPNAPCVWKIDLQTGDVREVLSYKDFAEFCPRNEMKDTNAVHKVNHLMLSPNGTRFMVLYRWFVGQKKYTRLITCNTDGSDMFLLSDDDMVSHCFWKDDDYILAFENKNEVGTGYYLMKDKSTEYVHLWKDITGDGHPSYNPEKTKIVTDSYPDRARIAKVYVMGEYEKPNVVAKVFAPFKYDNDTRCDLHPRWSPSGGMICFDSVFEGRRGLYFISIKKGEKVV